MEEDKYERINVVFKLKSPIHIGYISTGFVVSPTRYYVPGRNFWGAATKRITEYLYKKPDGENYKKVGGQVKSNFIFSYFYLYDGETIYFPRYTEDGLKYGSNRKLITQAEFEHRFIGSRISTGINSNGTAKDESLHEIEFINNRFKDENGELKSVKIAGCICIKKDAKIEGKGIIIKNSGIFIDDFNIVQELILGGESKYGFGHVLLDSINSVEFSNFANFKWEDSKKIKCDKFTIAHLKYEKDIKFKGDVELLSGRGYFDPEDSENKTDEPKPGKVISQPEYYFAPGTMVKCEKEWKCIINWDGTLLKV